MNSELPVIICAHWFVASTFCCIGFLKPLSSKFQKSGPLSPMSQGPKVESPPAAMRFEKIRWKWEATAAAAAAASCKS